MKIKVLAFGIAKDIFGGPSVMINMQEPYTTATLKVVLEKQYPRLQQLRSFMIAVNDEYAAGDYTITEQDEIAIIPPVSGG